MNRTAIKEHVITILKKTYGDKHSITGDYPENIKNIAIVVSILGEREIVGRGQGRISYDYITGKEKTMYVSAITIGITVYSPIDEEAAAICGDIQSEMRSSYRDYISEERGVGQLRDISAVTSPSIVTGGHSKMWSSGISAVLIATEIIEA